MHVAAENGHRDVVEPLLRQGGADLDAKDELGWTALHHAVSKGHLEVAKLLLDRGADVDLADKKGRAPLSFAAANGHLDVAKLLLDRGADVDVRDEWGRTALDRAKEDYQGHSWDSEQEKERIRKGRGDVVELLRKWAEKKDRGKRNN